MFRRVDNTETFETRLSILALATGVRSFAGLNSPSMSYVPTIPAREGPCLHYIGIKYNLDEDFE